MATRRENLSSARTGQILTDSLVTFMNDSINMSIDDEVSKNASNFVSKLSIDDNGYLWKGNPEQLRCFVQDDLNLTGKWSSPGGERKVFTCSTEGIKLKWFGPT